MELCILGLIMIAPRTLYDLSKEFEQIIALFYSSSIGSLHLTLKKMVANGYISAQSEFQGKREKKVYKIEPQGSQAFFELMFAPIAPTKLETTALCRLYFLGLLEHGDRQRAMEIITTSIEESLNGLLAVQAQLSSLQIPKEYQDIFSFQIATLDYGIMAHRAGFEWFLATKKDLSK